MLQEDLKKVFYNKRQRFTKKGVVVKGFSYGSKP
jgi:hypothetical protein